MASYPGSIFSPRAVADREGVVYDAAKTKVFFAKDHNDFGSEIVAIQNVLGIDFDKTFREVSKEGLVLAMNFNSESIDGNKVLDSSGYNNHGDNNGADHDPDGGFNGGGAFDFNGSSDYIRVSHNASQLISNGGTIAFWVWVDSNGGDTAARIIDKSTAGSGADGYQLALHNSFTRIFARVGSIDIISMPVNSFDSDEWVHIVLSFTSAGVPQFYVNGVAVITTGSGTPANITGEIPLDIGHKYFGDANHFDGLLDEPRIYNRVLSADEIRNLYKARKEIHNSFVSQKNILVNPDGSLEFLNNAFDADGQKLMSGDARVIRHLRVGAASWNGGAVAPVQAFDGLWVYLAFDKLSDDSVHFILIVPSRWDISTDIEFVVDWYYTGAQDNGTVCWGLEYKSIKGGEVVTGAGTIISKVSAGSHLTGKMVRTTFTVKILHGNLEEGDTIGLRLFRDISEDTLDTDAKLLNTHFHFTQNKLGDAI